MLRVIAVDQDRCNGCQLCQLACEAAKSGRSGLESSRIRVFSPSAGCNLVVTCNHCQEPACAIACLMEVIAKDKDGLTTRDEERCIGCRACIAVCPWGAIVFDADREVAVSCDVCSGHPLCVEFCPTGALELVAVAEASAEKRQLAVEKAVLGRQGMKTAAC